jgi:CHAT domain-containing protein
MKLNKKRVVEIFDSVLNIYRIIGLAQDSALIIDAWFVKACVFKAYEQYDTALLMFQNVIRVKSKYKNDLDLKRIAYCYNVLGSINSELGNFSTSLHNYEHSLRIKTDIYGLKHKETILTRSNIAALHSEYGLFNEAIKQYHLLLEELVGNTLVDTVDFRIKFMLLLGNTYGMKGDYDNAVLYHTLVYEFTNEKKPKDSFIKASILNGIGIDYKNKGDLNRSVEFHEQALLMRIRLAGEDSPIVANSLMNLGVTHIELKEWGKAIEFLKKTVVIFEKNNLGNQSLFMAYDNLGLAYAGARDYKEALVNQRNGLRNLRKLYGDSHPTLIHSYQMIAATFHSVGQIDSAIYFFNQSLELCEALNVLTPKFIVQNNLGTLYTIKGYYVQAKQVLLKSILENSFRTGHSSLEEVISPVDYLISHNELAKAYAQEYAINNFKTSIDSAITIQEKALNDYQFFRLNSIQQQDNQLLSNLQTIFDNYCKLISCKVCQSNNSLSFRFLQNVKSVTLFKALKESKAQRFSKIPDSLLVREHDFRENLTKHEKAKQELIDQDKHSTDTTILRISSIIFDLKRDYEVLKKRFETDYPAYYRLKYDLNTVSLRYVQDTLLQSQNQALLEYFVGDSSIYLFVVRPDTMIVQEVKRDFPLEDWIEQLRQGLYGYYTADQGKRTTALYNNTQKQYIEYAQKLYKKLVAPVQPWLLEQVIVVPDGPLGYVPFDALLTDTPPQDSNDFKSYPYLLNKHQFSYTYSATLLKEMCDIKHHRTPTKKFAAFAPFYTGDTSLLANMYAYNDLMRKDLQPLAYSGSEVAAASKLMHGEIIAGTAATEERFTSTAGDYRILHLATHGRADNRVGDYAFLAFTEIKDSIENELLYVKDLYNLELNADLVVLSACETGIGKLQRGEGIISLARAFAYAGAKSIVTTLWEVNDKSTSELMRYFYRELRKGKTKDEALRSARKAYLEKSKARTCHPFFWAAFVPVGDMRAVK